MESGLNELIEAVINNDYVKIENLIDFVNMQNEENNTSLFFVNNYNTAKLLLENGANVYIQNDDGNTPLMCMIGNANHNFGKYYDYIKSRIINYDIIQLLIDYGSDLNIKNNYGEFPLSLSCLNNDIHLAEILIYNGAYIDNTINNDGYTTLMIAINKNNLNFVKLLINSGANIDIKSYYGETALIISCEYNNLEITKYLIYSGAKIDLQNNNNETALIISCEYDNFEAIKLLINNNADINHIDFIGRNCLIILCEKFHSPDYTLIKFLIIKGININHIDDNGNSAFIYSCKAHEYNIMKLLLAAGCDVDYNNIYVDNTIKYINNYLNSKEYIIDKNNLQILINREKSALIFSSLVLLSDDYLKFI